MPFEAVFTLGCCRCRHHGVNPASMLPSVRQHHFSLICLTPLLISNQFLLPLIVDERLTKGERIKEEKLALGANLADYSWGMLRSLLKYLQACFLLFFHARRKTTCCKLGLPT